MFDGKLHVVLLVWKTIRIILVDLLLQILVDLLLQLFCGFIIQNGEVKDAVTQQTKG